MNSIAVTSPQLLLEGLQPPTRSLSSHSPLASDEVAQKKRLFVRKPSANPPFILADKKRKESFKETSFTEVLTENFKKEEVQAQTCQTKIPQLQDASFVNQEKETVVWTKDMFFKPCPSQNQLLSGLKYIQRNSFKLNRKDLKRDFVSEKETSEMDATTDRSTESLLHNCKSSDVIKVRPPNIPQNPSSKDKSPKILQGSKPPSQEKWCVNCRNNKQKCQMLTEKCSKLQEQLELKNKTIKDLTDRIEQLNFEKIQSEKQMEKLISKDMEMTSLMDALERRVFQSEQDFNHNFQTAKKEVQRLNERLKYMEMENTMLLRYKEEYSMVAKQCDRLRYDNDHLKRQLNSIARMDNSFNFTKKNKVQIKNPMLTDRHKGPKGITPSNSSKDEDAISLDLSEWSVEQF